MAAAGPGVNVPINNTGQIIRADVVTHHPGLTQLGMFSLWYRVSSVGGTGVLLGAVASMLDGVFAGLMKPILTVNANYRGVQARVMIPKPASVPAYEAASAGAGTVAGDGMAPQVCGVISLYTASAGRRYRGRRYIPFPSETDNGPAGLPSAGYLAALDSIKNAIVAIQGTGVAGNTVGLTPILWHRDTEGYTDLLGGQRKTGWGTQRRRGYFGRQNVQPF